MEKKYFVFLTISCLSLLSVHPIEGKSQTNKKLPIEQRKYEDFFTFKYQQSFIKDPWVWGYSKEFASKFHMPEEWVEPELTGVLAVAFRMTTIGQITCGLGGKENNCWEPVDCQMDIYYDNRIKLPWTKNDVIKDFFMKGIASTEYLNLVEQNNAWREKYKFENKNGYLINKVGVEAGLLFAGKYSYGGGRITYFDREFTNEIGLIGWVGPGFCPRGHNVAVINFYENDTMKRGDKNKINTDNISLVHQIIIPESYIYRANQVFEKYDQKNKKTTDRLIRDFKKNNL